MILPAPPAFTIRNGGEVQPPTRVGSLDARTNDREVPPGDASLASIISDPGLC